MQHPEELLRELHIVSNIHIATFLVQFVNILSIAYCVSKVDYAERKTLLILSTYGTNGALFVLALYLLVADQKLQVLFFNICLPVVLIIHILSFQLGLATMPTVLLSELFPTELNGFVGAIIVTFDGIIGFCVSKLYEVMNDYVGLFWIYSFFPILCSLVFLMVYIQMPETKGKTYNEIEVLLDGKNLHSSNEEAVIDESDIYSL